MSQGHRADKVYRLFHRGAPDPETIRLSDGQIIDWHPMARDVLSHGLEPRIMICLPVTRVHGPWRETVHTFFEADFPVHLSLMRSETIELVDVEDVCLADECRDGINAVLCTVGTGIAMEDVDCECHPHIGVKGGDIRHGAEAMR